jgi:acetyl esterase
VERGELAEGGRAVLGDRLAGELADAELAAWVLALRAEPRPPAAELGADLFRASSRARNASRPRGPELERVADVSVPRPARLYGKSDAVVVYLHGGCFTFGDLDSHDRFCRRLSARAGCSVLAVDYRLAPEDPWPAAVEDAVAALAWARERFAGPVAVAGDSSGGCVAALACLELRDSNHAPAAQLLANPNTDLTLASPSVTAKGSGWGLEAEDLRWFIAGWTSDPAAASPLHAPDLSGLPPALVVTSEHDPLRDEGDAYAARLAAAGVSVMHRFEPGMVHGFVNLDPVSPAARAAGDRWIDDAERLLRAAPAPPAR